MRDGERSDGEKGSKRPTRTRRQSGRPGKSPCGGQFGKSFHVVWGGKRKEGSRTVKKMREGRRTEKEEKKKKRGGNRKRKEEGLEAEELAQFIEEEGVELEKRQAGYRLNGGIGKDGELDGMEGNVERVEN